MENEKKAKHQQLRKFVNQLNKELQPKYLDFSKIEAIKTQESGFYSSIIGLSLSFKKPQESFGEFIEKFYENNEYLKKKIDLAKRLAFQDGGHNKFLESIVVWYWIKIPRYLWSEFDTYRVGMTKNSESTMHTLTKYGVTEKDFIHDISNDELKCINEIIKQKNLSFSKSVLPEGFLQGRLCCFNYKTLRNMILQRRNHRLTEWQNLLYKIAIQLQFPYLLPPIDSQYKTLEENILHKIG